MTWTTRTRLIAGVSLAVTLVLAAVLGGIFG